MQTLTRTHMVVIMDYDQLTKMVENVELDNTNTFSANIFFKS